ISRRIAHMSLQDKIAQMYLVPSDGNQNDVLNAIQQYHVGGVVLFGADFQNQTPDQCNAKLAGWQKASQIPLFIGTDQEGGTVSRLSDNPQLTNNRQFPSPPALNNNMQAEVNEALDFAWILHNLGVTSDFAPVAHDSNNPQSLIYPRTVGKDYHQTATYISEVVPAIESQKVVAALTHRPGYGTE